MKTTCNELLIPLIIKKNLIIQYICTQKTNKKQTPKKPVYTKNVLELYNKSGCVLSFGKDSIFGPGLP